LLGKTEGKRPPRKPRRRRENNIKIDLTEIGWKDMGWIVLAQDRDRRRVPLNTAMKLQVT
jgi:hypothetical protein